MKDFCAFSAISLSEKPSIQEVLDTVRETVPRGFLHYKDLKRSLTALESLKPDTFPTIPNPTSVSIPHLSYLPVYLSDEAQLRCEDSNIVHTGTELTIETAVFEFPLVSVCCYALPLQFFFF